MILRRQPPYMCSREARSRRGVSLYHLTQVACPCMVGSFPTNRPMAIDRWQSNSLRFGVMHSQGPMFMVGGEVQTRVLVIEYPAVAFPQGTQVNSAPPLCTTNGMDGDRGRWIKRARGYENAVARGLCHDGERTTADRQTTTGGNKHG